MANRKRTPRMKWIFFIDNISFVLIRAWNSSNDIQPPSDNLYPKKKKKTHSSFDVKCYFLFVRPGHYRPRDIFIMLGSLLTRIDPSPRSVDWFLLVTFFFFFTLLPPALDCLLTLTRPPPLFTRIIILMKRNKKRLCCWHVTATVTLCKDVAIMADHRYSSRQ